MEEQNVVIIGSGRMGIGIATALLLADRGLDITLVDLKERPSGQENDSLDSARNEIESNLNLLEELGELRVSPKKLIEGLSLSRSLEDAVTGSAYILKHSRRNRN
jgi:3-hydroxyacyl-CoA dehydrogenase